MLFVKKEEESCESVERGSCQILNRGEYLRQLSSVCCTLQVKKALCQKFDWLISRAVRQVGRQRPPGLEGVDPESRSRANEGGISARRFVLRRQSRAKELRQQARPAGKNAN
jgi:hypothetical protein